MYVCMHVRVCVCKYIYIITAVRNDRTTNASQRQTPVSNTHPQLDVTNRPIRVEIMRDMIYIHMHFVIQIVFQFFNGRNEKQTEGRTDGCVVVQQERSGDIINVAQYFPLPIFTPHKYLLKTALSPPAPTEIKPKFYDIISTLYRLLTLRISWLTK